MKILLVTPAPKEAFTQIWPTLGLCYLSSYLKSKGIMDIEGIDLNVETIEDLERAAKKSDLVGIYCSTKASTSAFEVAEIVKGFGKTVVMGGPHVSILPEEALTRPYVDFVVLSEGEESFHELILALEQDGDYSSIDGFGFKKDGVITVNPKTKYIKNLDDIPFPDRSLFNFQSLNNISLSFSASRGCPYKCANCQPALSIQTCRFRLRSVDNVIAELKTLDTSRHIHFVDNDLSVNKKWLAAFCDRVSSEKLDISWDCQGRVNTLTLELMKAMKKAGCTSIGLGIESGSQEFLDNFLHKNIRLDRAKELFIEAREIGMGLHCWYIIGIPTESKTDIERTIDFALCNEVASVGFSIATPWPGTIFHKVASENGWILAKEWDEYNEKRYSMLSTGDWNQEDIANYRKQIIDKFTQKGWDAKEDDFIFVNPVFLLTPAGLLIRKILHVTIGREMTEKLKLKVFAVLSIKKFKKIIFKS